MDSETISLYTVPEVAEMLKVGKDYVYDRVEDKTLRCYRFGRSIRFSMAQVNDYIDRVEMNKDGQG